ncbi:MAG: hypothetical protein C0428_08205 [Polaromonas sp.]|nr:hypothetical protein [Polaromonas sp.]
MTDLLDGIARDVEVRRLQTARINALICLQGQDYTFLVPIVHARSFMLKRTHESQTCREIYDPARRRTRQKDGALQYGLQLVAQCRFVSHELLHRPGQGAEPAQLPRLHVVSVGEEWIVLGPVVHAV